MPSVSRNVVYWAGLPPSATETLEFERRRLTVRICDATSPPDMNVARGLVFNARPPDVSAAVAGLQFMRAALDHGLMIYLVAADDAIQAYLQRSVPVGARPRFGVSTIRIRTGDVSAHELAENIARHDAGRPANSLLDIQVPAGVVLLPRHEFLVRRAFSDCSTISIQPLTGGRSATAFIVQATLVASEAGPRPLPFFAKIDSAPKIFLEATNYELYALQHIPWYLRPNVDDSRSILGIEEGILVGSFVEHSESLWQAVLQGRGRRYIHALFEDTLMGWRSQAYRTTPTRTRIANVLRSVFSWEKVPAETVRLAAAVGNVAQPQVIWERLISLPDHEIRMSPMHGDMHGENVRVRNGDSIIIDLANVGIGPLFADLASLEVWLAFEMPRTALASADEARWQKLVTELFEPGRVLRPPALASRDQTLDWLTGCVRQTRMLAHAVCGSEVEYATAIALYLLRRAQYVDMSVDGDQHRRAVAYYLASQIVEWLSRVPSRGTAA